ncbi:MAG: hypothetical protein KF824_08015 [Fimbriimonadaceae bacterium]|nr:MAG: hypothetical protein KF824_08015 [Fimbriimonadaceae bacterium]
MELLIELRYSVGVPSSNPWICKCGKAHDTEMCLICGDSRPINTGAESEQLANQKVMGYGCAIIPVILMMTIVFTSLWK